MDNIIVKNIQNDENVLLALNKSNGDHDWMISFSKIAKFYVVHVDKIDTNIIYIYLIENKMKSIVSIDLLLGEILWKTKLQDYSNA